jgi:hypothetical protein
MTDRYNALIVVLDKDIREDDAENIMQAIRQYKHVASVSGHVSDINSVVAEKRVKNKIMDKMFELIKEDIKK